MKARVVVGVFLAFLPVLAFAQSTTAQQLLQALLPPNAVTPQISAPISVPVSSSIATPINPSATLSPTANDNSPPASTTTEATSTVQQCCLSSMELLAIHNGTLSSIYFSTPLVSTALQLS
jgi:hypothetical protein